MLQESQQVDLNLFTPPSEQRGNSGLLGGKDERGNGTHQSITGWTLIEKMV
jgi:hypothetical protein